MPERWATFDCYGTLIDWDRGVGDALAGLWPDADRSRLLRDYHGVEPLVQHGSGLSYREVLIRSLRAIAAIEALPLADERSAELADSLPSWRPFAEVPTALAELRERGWRIAVLSNTDPNLLDASLAAIGVPVDLTITAAEAGSYKPAHGHWRAFFDRAGIDPGRCVHVGASPFHDLAPAAELGLTAVWINRSGDASAAARAAELADLRLLPETLDGLLDR